MNEIVEKAKQLNKFQKYIPELEENETVELNDLWDGEGDIPEYSYSYLLNDDSCETYINYKFEVIQVKENPLDTIIKILKIELL